MLNLSYTETDPKQILQKYWGFKSFRMLQEDIIRSVLEGNDTLALLPTGGGKSICYQVPAMMKEGICIVVSPLIALIKDQVTNLRKKEIRAAAIFSGMSKKEIDMTLDNCIYGEYKFLYLSPERLGTEIVKVRIEKMKVNLLAVDEAHCISQWGYDFRPAYLKIAEIRSLLPETPVLALTATATEDVKNDIAGKLLFREPRRFQSSFERKNIAYVVRYEEGKLNKLVSIFNKVKGTGIVYVRNRKKTREIAEYLLKHNLSADHYHAGLDMNSRSMKQEKWISGKIRIMVCTNAFGMGIDKPDVRCVVHVDLPENVESYYQESGRAGRDGKKSFAVLLYNLSDKFEIEKRIKNNFPSVTEIATIYNALGNYFQIATGSGMGETYEFDIVDFCHTFNLNPTKVHQSLKLLEQQGILVSTESVFLPSRLKIIVNKEELYKFQVANKRFDPFIRMLLRTHIGMFEEFVMINEQDIGKRLNLPKPEVISNLSYLHKQNLVDYEKQRDKPQITFLVSRQDAKHVGIDIGFIEQRKKLYEDNLKSMLAYSLNKNRCRSQFVLDYFGEKDNYRCGICDVCLERNKLGLSDLEYDSIMKEIKKEMENGHTSVQEIIRNAPRFNEKKIIQALHWMIDSGQVVKDEHNNLVWSE